MNAETFKIICRAFFPWCVFEKDACSIDAYCVSIYGSCENFARCHPNSYNTTFEPRDILAKYHFTEQSFIEELKRIKKEFK